jgi:hypothetical protein
MTITELYEQLASKDFQDPDTSKLFFPAYMYMYNPEQEYQVQEEIQSIKDRLYRPSNYLNVLTLDIFQEFCAYLRSSMIGEDSKYDDLISDEQDYEPEITEKLLKNEANDDMFFKHIYARIEEHFETSNNQDVGYVFVHGFGAIYPYLRASTFLNNFERYINYKYKIILFYPGTVKGNYNLFGLLNDENIYRAIKLLN